MLAGQKILNVLLVFISGVVFLLIERAKKVQHFKSLHNKNSGYWYLFFNCGQKIAMKCLIIVDPSLVFVSLTNRVNQEVMTNMMFYVRVQSKLRDYLQL